MSEKNIGERYLGHLSLEAVGEEGQRAIMNGRVLIVGVGGLGSPVSLYLAAAGVGCIGLADSDVVSLSNLQRQIVHSTAEIGELKVDSAERRIKALNPDVKIVKYARRFLGKDDPISLDNYDVVVDCTDCRQSRLAVSEFCKVHGKPLVFGAVSGFCGMAFTYRPGHASYSDIFSWESDDDAAPRSCARSGILNSVVGIVGSIQATEVLKILTGVGGLLTDRLLTFDARNADVRVLSVR